MQVGNPIRFGLTGLGGHAGETAQRLLAEMALPHPRARLEMVCEPRLDRYAAIAERLRGEGIRITDDYEEILSDPAIDMAWLALPIDLHCDYTQKTLGAGKHVLLEKPAAGSVDEVDAIIAARDQAGLIVAVGFQDLYQPAVAELKRRLLRGEFGIILSASVIGCWPRSERYYTRNDWAGRIARDGRWVLDSPVNNAMAHHLHLALFLLGNAEHQSTIPTEVEAELYRANPIENYDTASLRLTFANGVHLLLGMTHACESTINPEIVIRTQFATIRFVHEKQIEIHRSAATEIIPLIRSRITPMIEVLRKWLSGNETSVIGATLEMARAHTLTVNAASQIAPIIPISSQAVQKLTDAHGDVLWTVPGIESALECSIRNDRMLHETGKASWSRPASDFDLKDYAHFIGPADPGKKPGS